MPKMSGDLKGVRAAAGKYGSRAIGSIRAACLSSTPAGFESSRAAAVESARIAWRLAERAIDLAGKGGRQS